MLKTETIPAVILSIGDELVLGQGLDTNGRWLAECLGEHGVVVSEHRTLGDDRAMIAGAIRMAIDGGAEVVVMTGGLGPTEDDLTRFAIADISDPQIDLVQDPGAARVIQRWFAKRGKPVLDRNMVQAMRPASATLIPNTRGTAPGLAVRVGTCDLFALPGPPWEMQFMFEQQVRPLLRERLGDVRTVRTAVHAYGLGESTAAERLGELLTRGREPLIGITAHHGTVTATVRVLSARPDAAAQVEADRVEVEQRWAPYAFGRDGASLAGAVAALLAERGETLVTAESCTGGWLGKSLVDIAGCSAMYLGGWVTYHDDAKVRDLGVSRPLLDEHGAVSAPVARAMAEGALERGGTTWSLAITGIAGPDGGSVEKPVGLVYIALGHRRESSCNVAVRRFQFAGDRSSIRERSVGAALAMLRLEVMGQSDSPLLWEYS